jgi:two-component system, NtrC family, sensor histidine kinase GlrK
MQEKGAVRLKLSIYARLVISYLVFAAMLAGVSFFFIYHLDRFNQVIQSIVVNDTAATEFSIQLSDTLLSEVRNERKYVLLNDDQLYQNYLETGNEFERLLQKALAELTSPETAESLQAVADQHLQFTRLVEEERRLRQSGAPYSVMRFNEEKKNITDGLIATLKKIQEDSEKSVFVKVRNLKEVGGQAREIAIMIALGALSAGLLVAAAITRSITRPLQIIKDKTREIAQGNFECNLKIKSPPSIKELAIALNYMCGKLAEVDNLKSAFFAHMSHELRTPLASIREGTKILLDGLAGELNEKQRHILAIIVQESDRLINLVNSLLDLAKMEAGMLDYHFARSDLPALVREVLQGLQPLAEARGVRLINTISDLPTVNVDRERLMQVVRNLVGNAIKFTPEQGAITLTAEIRDKMLEVAVRDTGTGIPEDELTRIFLKFRQVLPDRSGKIKGTGLGLATVKQIILAHGGTVWATSQTGKGSTFYFTLPLAD